MTMYVPTIEEGGEPLYKLLADAMERDIVSGILAPGERLPTHRDLADELGFNVSTITRGYREAEKRGLVSGTVGRGTFVASDAATSTALVSFEPAVPGLIELGLVAPLHQLDPDLSDGLKRISRRKDPAAFMRYSDPRGMLEHRRAGADWASRYGMPANPEEIVVCAGSQHALTCVLSGLFQAGDRIATDELTYPGFKTLAAMLGIRLVPIRMDEHGLIPSSLDAACRRDRIKAVYLMPGFHNPTTTTIPDARRRELAKLCDWHDLLIIEDDAYDLTTPNTIPPVGCHAPHRSLFIAGMSKSLAAGLRVSFVVTPRMLLKDVAQAVLNTIWMAPSLNAELATMWISDETADKTIKRKSEAAARRYMLACDILEGYRFRGKKNGFYLWLDLPEPWTGATLEAAAREKGLNLFGAQKFAVGETSAPNAARISITGPDTLEELQTGLAILRDLLG